MTTATALPMTEHARQEVDQAITLYDHAQTVTIATVDDYSNAGALLQDIKNRSKQIDELRKSMTSPLDMAKKKIMDFFRPAADKLNDAATIISRTMIAWENEQERIRKEEERKREEEARKRAEEEALAMATEAEQSGDAELAEAIISQPVEVAPVKIQSAVPRTAQAFSREVWSAEVTDLMALVKAIATGQAPLNLVQANTTALNGMARSLKSSMKYPGVRAICNKTMTSRRA